MQKLISSGESAMNKILEGVDLVANPVKSTMSPMGKTVIISKSFVADYNVNPLPTESTKDGYKVSQSITAQDPEVGVGVRLVQEACQKQVDEAGDATSLTALLTQAILSGGIKMIKECGGSVDVVNGIRSAVDYVVSILKENSTPINGDVNKIRQVATICSNNDSVIGDLIAEAFDKIGDDGIIQVAENKGRETTIRISDGIKFGRGWESPYFVTNQAKGEAELVNPYILIYDRPITMLNDTQNGTGILPIINLISQAGKRPLVIFCDDCDGEAMATLTFNTQQNRFQSCVVSMAFLGEHKRDFMEDIAAATGGTFVNELKGVKLENVTLGMLGQAEKVVVSKEETIITAGQKNEEIFNSLVASLKAMEEKEEDLEKKHMIKQRIARLKGSVAILGVGATTEIEMKEKKDRVEDAVMATRSSVESGYVVGGGTAYLRVAKPVLEDTTLKAGYDLVFDCLKKSLEQICINSEANYDDIYKQVMWGHPNGDKGQFNQNTGFNAKTGKVEDLVKSGIIEPTKSNICALQNAASVCCQILSSSYMITDTL